MSEETLDIHYGKHHAAYVTNLNNQIKDTDMDSMDVHDIMIKSWNNGSPAATFNNAAQVVNHTFFWESMAPNAGGKPTGDLAVAIDRDFGSFDEFKAQFSAAGATQFGSGWAWLSVDNETKKLEVTKTPNAENPWCAGSSTPILTMDVWEVRRGAQLARLSDSLFFLTRFSRCSLPSHSQHAYYIDVRNRRPDYISSFFELINWDAVAARYAKVIA